MRPWGTLLAAAVLLALCIAAPAQVTTAFTYQGELRFNGAPADGLNDFQFALFDEGGGQLGPTLCLDDVPVTRGHFTVLLDFGDEYSNHEQRFLEIHIRPDDGTGCGDASGFEVLAPRQALTAAPFASSALTAADALRFGGEEAGFYRDASNLNAGTLAASRLPAEVARVDLANSFQADNTFFGTQTSIVSPLSLGATAAPQAPLHVREGDHGGAGYNVNAAAIFERSSACFLQLLTPDAFESGVVMGDTLGGVRGAMLYNDSGLFDLRFRTENATRLTIEADGDVGIGTTAPAERLHVAGNLLATGSLSTSNFKAVPVTDSGGSPTANVLGGYVGNVIGPGVTGATIAGGGRPGFGTGGNFFQEVLDDYGFVGGGRNNRVGDGLGTTGDAALATIAGVTAMRPPDS